MKKTITSLMTLLLLAAILGGCQGGETNDTATTEGESGSSAVTESPGTSLPDDVPEGYTVAKDLPSEYAVKEKGFVYVNTLSPYFAIEGIEHPNDNGGEFFRLDAADKENYPNGVALSATRMAGVAIRFRVKAAQISIRIKMRNATTDPPITTTFGALLVDIYAEQNGEYIICPSNGLRDYLVDVNGFTERVLLPGGEAEMTIYLPSFAGITSLEIGLPLKGWIGPPEAHTYGDVAFCGGKVTQGSGVSRSCITYPSLACRLLDAGCVNLGLADVADAEATVAAYLGGRDISAAVVDWSYAKNYEFYRKLREAKPDLPILLLAPPDYRLAEGNRLAAVTEAVKETYRLAKETGDEKVFLLDGGDYFAMEAPDLCTVDGENPNELGHFYMAYAVEAMLRQILAPQ